MRRRYLLSGAAALACVLIGVGLLLLALDVARARASFRDDDVRYRATPESTLWQPAEAIPGGVARRLLGVEDDLLVRRAIRGVRISHPETPGLTDPAYIASRNEATAWLTDIVQGDDTRARRSRAANLLGTLSFADAITDYENRGKLLASAAGRFRQAIALDPSNAEAKFNLETALSSARGLELSESGGGTNPSPGGEGCSDHGSGDGAIRTARLTGVSRAVPPRRPGRRARCDAGTRTWPTALAGVTSRSRATRPVRPRSRHW